MRRALAAAAIAVLALTGCAGSDEPSSAAEETPATTTPPSASESPEDSAASPPGERAGHPIEIEIEGDRVEPRGERVQVTAGEPVTLKVRSDRPAELHVHSSPEQELEVDAGETMLRLTIETPGIVDVEEHETGTIAIQLEVR
jgi:hypothetical protein